MISHDDAERKSSIDKAATSDSSEKQKRKAEDESDSQASSSSSADQSSDDNTASDSEQQLQQESAVKEATKRRKVAVNQGQNNPNVVNESLPTNLRHAIGFNPAIFGNPSLLNHQLNQQSTLHILQSQVEAMERQRYLNNLADQSLHTLNRQQQQLQQIATRPSSSPWGSTLAMPAVANPTNASVLNQQIATREISPFMSSLPFSPSLNIANSMFVTQNSPYSDLAMPSTNFCLNNPLYSRLNLNPTLLSNPSLMATAGLGTNMSLLQPQIMTGSNGLGAFPGVYNQNFVASAPDPETLAILQSHRLRTTQVYLSLPALLALPEDNLKLSNHQVLLRQQIEAFQATEDDITTHTRGRNKPVTIGQVGIRCRHCAHLPVSRRQKGSTYFPASLLGVYQAAQNMSTTHMQCGLCTEMPDSVKQQFAQLISTKVVSSGAGRPYWAQAAKKLGLVDTEEGIRFIKDLPPNARIVQSTNMG